MVGLTFGIHLEGELDGIETTLAGIAAFDPDARPLLLADGLDALRLARLRELANARGLAIVELGNAGGAGAFERLAEQADADCLGFVEAGVEFGAQSIERLLAVLDDEAIGMAGPTFDRGWNEQAALRELVDQPLAVAVVAAERLDGALDDLAPLYSLATGCLFVHRRVLDRIGGVDPGYGVGPCWEMDLHVRCVRAGLRGVWVPHAFVRRRPSTRLRSERERAEFERSRRRYQDRFCGLRRVEPLRPYAAHCQGDACPHFAPITAIPKLVHILWIGEREPPWACIESWTRDFAAAHPDWRVELWRDDDIERLGLENAREYADAAELCGKADVARYEIVWRQGGVYIDADSFWLGRPLEPLLAAGAWTGFVGAREGEGELVMCNFFAATKGHAILREVIDRLPARAREQRGEPAWIATGPALLGEVVHRIMRARSIPLASLVPAEQIVARSWHGITRESIPLALAEYRREGTAILLHLGYSTNELRFERPLVSCIMPTTDRAVLVDRAVELFHRQNWPQRELVIVHEGLFPIGHLRGDPQLRLVRAPVGLDIGSKRNLGIEQARGDWLMQWDDDDWYANDRISTQLEPLVRGEAEISAFTPDLFFHLERGEFWSVDAEQRARMFVADVLGGTLAFTRAAWRDAGGYPAASLAEDAALLLAMTKRGHRLVRLANDDRCVYVRHGRNTWTFALTGSAWTRRGPPAGMAREDLAFYEHFARTALGSPGWRPSAPALISSEPLVSCLMPTSDRPVFVEQAVRYFLRQTWDRRELVVIDDGERDIGDRLPSDPRIVHVRIPRGSKLGDKRNLACERARGDIMVHWDDDDWYAPWRLHYQISQLHDCSAALVGIDRLHYIAPWADSPDSLAWQYTYPAEGPPWLAGGSLAYTRALWQSVRFRSLSVGEDNDFVARCPPGRLLRLADINFYVGVIHPRNTSFKKLGDARWHRQSVSQVFTLLGSDADFYRELP